MGFREFSYSILKRKKKMKIENRIAAFRAENFEEAFKGFKSFNLEDLKELAAQDKEIEEPSDWIECYIEEESSYLFCEPENMEMNSDAANEIFGNPEKWIISIDNMDKKKDYIGAISIIEKEDFFNADISFPLDFSKIPLSIIG